MALGLCQRQGWHSNGQQAGEVASEPIESNGKSGFMCSNSVERGMCGFRSPWGT